MSVIKMTSYSVSLEAGLDHFFSRPCDWTMAWSGTNLIYGWGHNHRGQLGGVEGPKVKIPQQCDTLSPLKPVQICGGEQSLFVVTADGKVRISAQHAFLSHHNDSVLVWCCLKKMGD
jgi:hypothetical protein